MPISADVQKQLNDIDWSLGWFDFALDVISSNFETLRQEFLTADPAKGKIFSDFQDIIGFKSSEVYSTLMRIQELALGTTQAFYRKYHGPFRDEAGSSLAEAQRGLIHSFESFLTQYKSVVDISIKFAFAFACAGITLPRRIDSFEKLMKIIDENKEPYYSLAIKSGLFSHFISDRSELQDVTNYRDYIIHHAYLTPEKAAEGVGGHLFFKYWLPKLTQKGPREYDIDTKSHIQLDVFCRTKLFLLFSILATITDSLFTDQIKEPHIKALQAENPELVKQVLVRISSKEVFADRVVDENGLRVLLRENSIDFGELSEESKHSERQFEGTKSYDGRDMSYLMEKIFYKPIGKVRVFKTRYIYDRDWRPPTDDRSTYGVTVAGVSIADFISSSGDAARIMDHLRRCGIVYVSKLRGAPRYASVKDDLKDLVLSLSGLSQIKWSMIQNPEMKYFRPRTAEETEQTKAILGKGAEEYLRKEDQDRERIQEDYRKWKEQPEHYHPIPMDIVRDSKVLQRISHQDFVAEKKQGFANWKSNKIIHLVTKPDGSTDRIESQFFPDEVFKKEKIEEIIGECEEAWSGEPKHFLDDEAESLKMHKEQYEKDVKNAREQFADIVKKYDYLKPVFASINKDVAW
jgi:hypothetical protein